jgi:hypothetical protein
MLRRIAFLLSARLGKARRPGFVDLRVRER